MASAGGLLLGRSLPARASCSLGQLLMEGRSLAHVPGSARLQAWACAATPTTGSLQTTTSSSSSSSSCCALVDDASSTISRRGLHLWTVPLAPRQSACARQGGGGRGGAVCPSAVSGGASGEVGPGGAAKAAGGKAASSSSSLPKGGKHKGGKPRPASPTVPPAASTSAGNGAPASATATLAASAPAAAASRGGAVVVDEAVEDGQQERDDAQEGGAFLASADVDPNQGQSLAPFMDAVVKVYCVHTEPNYSLPWQRKRQATSTSSGFMVMFGGKRRLLTNAHSVDYYTQVKVKRRGDDRKFLARVLSIGVDCDVALLDVEDEAFWEGATPLEFGTLPRLQDAVAVVGYPIGGDTISVTAGVVSRIEVTDYTHGSTDLLAIQIDAAINGGNSGGPVFNARGECCGIAFQALVGSDVENVGYVIPTQVVQHFLTDYERTGGFTGFPALGVRWQRMESDALRRAFGMAANQKGVLVRDVNPTSAAAQLLRPNDVLLSFDGVSISNDGTVPFRTGERIAFSYLISNKYVGDECVLRLLRGGQELELNVKLSKPAALIPPHLSNRDPSYFIVAGLVFTSVSEPYLQSEYGSDYATDSPVKLLEQLYHGMPEVPDQEVVVLSQVLACDATLGYEDIYNVQVLRFNDTPVNNLRHLAELVSSCAEPYMRWDLEYKEVVVLETQAALAATPDVMRSHSVPFLLSADLRKAGIAWPPGTA